MLQIAAPTRSKLNAYALLQSEAIRLSDEINAKYKEFKCNPIRLIVRHHPPDQVFELFRAADVCIVSSLHDGMNLVAKEFVAARDDDAGVLILSSFAGAASELAEAVIVNPYDTHGMANCLDVALRMPKSEQTTRMRLMRDLVRQRNVYRWAAQMLLDASWLRVVQDSRPRQYPPDKAAGHRSRRTFRRRRSAMRATVAAHNADLLRRPSRMSLAIAS